MVSIGVLIQTLKITIRDHPFARGGFLSVVGSVHDPSDILTPIVLLTKKKKKKDAARLMQTEEQMG